MIIRTQQLHLRLDQRLAVVTVDGITTSLITCKNYLTLTEIKESYCNYTGTDTSQVSVSFVGSKVLYIGHE